MATPARGIAKKQKRPASVTEVIAAAADIVIAQPMLLIVPMLLDLYYLLGWRIVPGSTFQRLQSAAADLGSSEGDQLARGIDGASTVDLTGAVAFVVPSFFAGATSDRVYRPVERATIAADNWGMLLLAVVAVVTVTMLAFGTFGLWIADTVMKRDRGWRERVRLAPEIGGRFVLTLLLVVAVIAVLCIPLVVALVGAAVLGFSLDGLALTVSLLIGLGLYILFYFAPDALLIDLVGPVDALRASSAVVRRNVWIALMFGIASLIISIGLASVFERAATNAPGLAIAIIANAFVGCVLWAASLLFYSERSRLLAIERATASADRARN